MLNRISFLRSEEAKLDREIENAKKKALELLSRKAEKAEKLKDEEVAIAAKDIIEAIRPSLSVSKPLTPSSGMKD
jgi:hypothetical protein